LRLPDCTANFRLCFHKLYKTKYNVVKVKSKSDALKYAKGKQLAKKYMFDSPGLVNFAVRLVDLICHLLYNQCNQKFSVKFFTKKKIVLLRFFCYLKLLWASTTVCPDYSLPKVLPGKIQFLCTLQVAVLFIHTLALLLHLKTVSG